MSRRKIVLPEVSYDAIRLTCEFCFRNDFDYTSKDSAELRGWTAIRPAETFALFQVHRWWDTVGVCPNCIKEIIRRRRTKPVRHKNALLMIGSVILGVFVVSAFADPPAPTGVGCTGDGPVFFARDGTLGITWQEFQDLYATDRNNDGKVEYLPWIQGTFDPTAEKTPCDMLTGGD